MDDVVKPAERRTDARYAIDLIGFGEMLYRNLPGGDRFEVRCLNISRGGLMVTMDPEVRTGDVLRLELVETAGLSRIAFECSIQWMRRNVSAALGRFYAGLAFRQAPADVVQTLLDHAIKTSPIALP